MGSNTTRHSVHLRSLACNTEPTPPYSSKSALPYLPHATRPSSVPVKKEPGRAPSLASSLPHGGLVCATPPSCSPCAPAGDAGPRFGTGAGSGTPAQPWRFLGASPMAQPVVPARDPFLLLSMPGSNSPMAASLAPPAVGEPPGSSPPGGLAPPTVGAHAMDAAVGLPHGRSSNEVVLHPP